ncbi:Icc-related predicted phosphoesterase [Bradyrhizobium ottawaense]|uniref:metallophosphoesterase n=1 Tax=Bradyrhizobium TaxID=374 RepID=UPI002161FF66|nr:metallophosphoesterase [Bradyrhizobium arachidis]UVO32307.1 metallophosphoesterase [Bradyrhizobium arachidis]
MKVQPFSDIHFDVHPTKAISIVEGVDVVVVAGDTCEGAVKAFEHLRRIVPIEIPIVMTLGNHEYYRRFIPNELALARAQAPAFNIHVLENAAVKIGGDKGILFVGATLWTNYEAFGEAKKAAAMTACASGMNDHRLIGWRKQPWQRFRPREAAIMHHQSTKYIDQALASSATDRCVVVSHHAVHWNSVDPRYASELVTAAFVSDMTALIEKHQPALWIHGHVHNSSDYRVGNTRIVCNPHGYGNENPAFNGALVLDVGT